MEKTKKMGGIILEQNSECEIICCKLTEFDYYFL